MTSKPSVLVLYDVNTTSGGDRYETNPEMCAFLEECGAEVHHQEYEHPSAPRTTAEWHKATKEIVQRHDAYLSPGGIFDLPNHFYISGTRPEPPQNVSWKPETRRASVDMALMHHFYRANKPILTICGGMQLMAGFMGARLGLCEGHQLPHPQTHALKILKTSALYDVLETAEAEITSRHREAVIEVPRHLTVSARTSDGLIEAIEDNRKRFVIGIQGHPEKHLSDPKSPWRKLFHAFVKAAL